MPTRYNDGAPVEPEKFLSTYEELVSEFGALSYQPEVLRGIWTHQSQRFEESNVRLVIDVKDTQQSSEFFRKYKQTLKERFRQIDLWIVSFEIRLT